MEYFSVAEGRKLSGLRLVLTANVPGPWGESAKAIFAARNVPYAAVAQVAMEANDDLFAWTGYRNAPIAILDDEPPLTGWLDIVMLAERLGSGPSLLPEAGRDRALCIGFSNEICGRGGLGWERRIPILEKVYGNAPLSDDAPPRQHEVLRQYGYSRTAVAAASVRMANILTALAAQLGSQAAAGSDYLVGDRLSVLDIHWACFSNMFSPLPRDVNPMPDYLWPLYSELPDAVAAALDPALLKHRDRIYNRHIGLPLDYQETSSQSRGRL
ncbi:MAG: glutathione binding-like protein [Sphingomonadaceae bacterium]